MVDDRSYHRYLKILFFSVPLIVSFIAAFNFVIDPYLVFNIPTIDGFNANKPAIASRLRLSKAYQVRHKAPEAIILGTSRAEFGLDPDHFGWSNKSTYNLNLSSGNIYELTRYFQHAHSIKALKQVVLALDFFQFNINAKNSPDFDELRLAVDSNGNQQVRPVINKDVLLALVSFDAFRSSIDTLFSQYQDPIYLSNGLINPEETIRGKLLNIIGHRQTFIRSERRYFAKTYNNYSFVMTDGTISAFDSYRRLLDMAYRANIDLRMLIGPSHARQFEVIAAKGLWPKFEKWKSLLVAINEEQAKEVGKKAFPLWDFSTYNAYVIEDVPPPGDVEAKMRWYWESSHYKKELGDLVLNRVFGRTLVGLEPDNGFGVLITRRNIDQHLINVRKSRLDWRNAHPADVAELNMLSE